MNQADTPQRPSNHSPGHSSGPGRSTLPNTAEIPALRKAAILVVSLEQPLASKLLAQLDRATVEMITLEIAQLDRIDPSEQAAVLEEFYHLGARRLRFGFEDLVKMEDQDLCAAYHDEDVATWALALSGAPRLARTKLLGALPAPSAATLDQALNQLGFFRLDDAEAAQAELADRLRRLHDLGRITLPDPEERDEIFV